MILSLYHRNIFPYLDNSIVINTFKEATSIVRPTKKSVNGKNPPSTTKETPFFSPALARVSRFGERLRSKRKERERERARLCFTRRVYTRNTRKAGSRTRDAQSILLPLRPRCPVGYFHITVPEFRSSSFNEERLFNIPALSRRENREMRGRGP